MSPRSPVREDVLWLQRAFWLLFVGGLLGILLAGGCRLGQRSVGVVPLDGTSLYGRVVGVVGDSAVLLKTSKGQDLLLPAPFPYTSPDGGALAASDLKTGTPVRVMLGAYRGALVRATAKLLVLDTGDGVATIPVPALPGGRTASVEARVRLRDGETSVVPLAEALLLQRSGATILPAPSFHGSSIAAWEPTMPHEGVLVSRRHGHILMVCPDLLGTTRLVAMQTAPQAFGSYRSGNAVRFMFLEGISAVSSWRPTDSRTACLLTTTRMRGSLLSLLPGTDVVALDGQKAYVPPRFVRFEAAPEVGAACRVTLPGGMMVRLIALQGRLVTLQTPYGYWHVPVQAVASTFGPWRRVPVLKADGRQIEATLPVALGLQQDQGAIIAPPPGVGTWKDRYHGPALVVEHYRQRDLVRLFGNSGGKLVWIPDRALGRLHQADGTILLGRPQPLPAHRNGRHRSGDPAMWE